MEKDFFAAIALLLVFEGMLPFLRPTRWRNIMSKLSLQSDKALRSIGLASMLLGVGLLYAVR